MATTFNTIPDIQDIFTLVYEGSTQSISLISSGVDEQNDLLSVTLVSIFRGYPGQPLVPTDFSLNNYQLTADGTFTYSGVLDLADGEQRFEAFTFSVFDGMATSTATIYVYEVGTGSVVSVPDDYAQTWSGQSVVVPVLVNDAMVWDANRSSPVEIGLIDGQPIQGGASVMLTDPVTHMVIGQVSLSGADSLLFTPLNGFAGKASFSYQASYFIDFSDPVPQSYTQSVTVDVLALQPAGPTGVSDVYFSSGMGPLVVSASTGVLANDIANGNLIRAQLMSAPDNGTIDFNSDGSFVFTPSIALMVLPFGSTATATFSYKVFSGTSMAASPTTVTLNLVQNAVPPVAVDDALSLNEDVSTVIHPADLFGSDGSGPLNDSGAGAPFSTILIEALPQHGALYLSDQLVSAGTMVSLAEIGAGALEYRPAANYAGGDSFQYRVSDGTAYSNIATVSLTVAEVNDAPTAAALNLNIMEGDVIGALPNLFSLVPSVTDLDDSVFRFRLQDVSRGPNDGGMPDGYASNAFILSADGYFSYDSRYLNLQPGQQQTETFHYVVTDGQNESTGVINVTVFGTDFGGPAPAAPTDYAMTPQGQAVSLDVTLNDVLLQPISLSPQIILISGLDAFEGTVSIADLPYATGMTRPVLTFTPNPAFTGLASFSYTVSYAYSPGPEQETPQTYSANVTVNVVPNSIIAAPDGVADTYTMPLFSEVSTGTFDGVLLNDVSPFGAALGAQLVSGPAEGALDFNANGSFTYRPTAQMLASAPGTELTVTFTYRVMNGSASDSDATPVTLLLRKPFSMPIAVDDHLTAGEDQPVVITTEALFGDDGAGPLNDSQPEGQAFTEIRILHLPGSGTLLLDGVAVQMNTVVSVDQLADGKLVFMPAPGFSGSTSFDYAVRASDFYSPMATVTLDIAAVPTSPQLLSPMPSQLIFPEAPDASAQQLLAMITPLQFLDPDSQALSAQVSLIHSVLSTGAAVPVDILNALSNALTITPILAPAPDGAGALLTVIPNFAATANLDFLPASGGMLFLYQIIAVDDTGLQSAPYVIPVQIIGANDAPHAHDLQIPMAIDSAVGAGSGLLSQVSDPDLGDVVTLLSANGVQFADAGSIVSVATPVGQLQIHADGSLSFVGNVDGMAMAQGEPAQFDIPYQVADAYGDTSTATLHLTVLGTNQGPTANPDQFAPVTAGGTVSFGTPALIANDFDPDHGESALLRIQSFGFGASVATVPVTGSTTLTGTYGVLTIAANGQFSYAATTAASAGLIRGAQESDTFTYTIADPFGATSTAEIAFDVVGANHAPVSVADSYAIAYGQPLSVDAASGVLKNDSDFDGDMLSAVLDTGPAHGSLTLNADGSFTYTPVAGYIGADSFSYHAVDGSAPSAVTQVAIAVQAPLLKLDKHLFINEIAVNAGAATITINTSNGALPDKVTTGVGRIELFNFSSGSISAADLAKASVEVVGLNAKLSVIGLDHLTGLTESATGTPLSGIALQANGSLVLHEPNAGGIGIWQTFSASGVLLLSGTYQDSSWGLGTSVSSPVAVNLAEAGLSIDFFAANGAPLSGLTDTGSAQTSLSGITTLGSGAHAQGSPEAFQLPDLSSPWFGYAQLSPGGVIPNDVLSLLNQNAQFNASLASSSDTVFARTYDHYLSPTGGTDKAFVDYNDAGDWTYGGSGILTLGKENVLLSRSVPMLVANAQDASDNANPLQGYQPVSDLIAGIANESGQTIAIFSGFGEGGRGHDFLYGVATDDLLFGDAGNDYLYGSSGNDWLDGGSGADRLMGGAGNDRLTGGSGRDWLNGGSGSDIFIFRSPFDSQSKAPDIIEDFVHGIDKIDLSALDANIKRGGDQAFTFAGRSSVAGVNAITWFESGGNTVVQADVDGNKTADMQIVLVGTSLGLTATDLVL